jgi:hypothetical protein
MRISEVVIVKPPGAAQMANPTDHDKETNPIAEIFDQMFTLLEDIETRNIALLDYMKEQGGVTDEKLGPYLDRASAASDVRWRAARARMAHLLAPKPKSSTEVDDDKKTKDQSQPELQATGKDAKSTSKKPQSEKKQEARADSQDLGKELTSAQPGDRKSPEPKAATSPGEEPASENKARENEQSGKNGDQKRQKVKSSTPSDAEEQASALGGDQKSESQKDENAKAQLSKSGAGKSSPRSSGEEKQQTQKAAK